MIPDRELPMLAGIASILRWLEELLNIINGPVLMFGAGIALVDLLTDGALTVAAPILLYAWAISQALGIDTQLLGCFARARHARGWHMVGWLTLGITLGFAAWQAGYVFAVQESQHITEAAALAQLDMSPALWLGWRTFLAVGLVALSGWTRYAAPAKASIEDERAKLERELTLEPLRAEVRMRKAVGWRDLGQSIIGSDAARPPLSLPTPAYTGAGAAENAAMAPEPSPDATATTAPPDDDRPPTGGGSPIAAPVRTPRRKPPDILRLTPDRPARRAAAQASAKGVRTPRADTASREAEARAAWANGAHTISAMRAATGMSKTAAASWVRMLKAELKAGAGKAAQ